MNDPVPQQPGGPSRLSRLLWRLWETEFGVLTTLVVVVLFFAVADRLLSNGHFVEIRNLRVVLNETSKVAVAALGMTLIIIAGGIDLSAGTALTLCAIVMAVCLKADVAPAIAVAATLGTGCASGLFNGLLISRLKVVPFIVTLGTMSVYHGLGKLLSGETTVTPAGAQIPDWLHAFRSTHPPDVLFGVVPRLPPSVWLALALALAVGLILRFTVFGRHVFALGSNEATARLCGVRVSRTKVAVYTLAGLFIGIAGMYHFASLKSASPADGMGLELRMIAAVVIGGGSLGGGRGSAIGTLTGATIIAVIDSGCAQLGVSNSYQDIITGAVIIAAVALDQYRQRRLAS